MFGVSFIVSVDDEVIVAYPTYTSLVNHELGLHSITQAIVVCSSSSKTF